MNFLHELLSWVIITQDVGSSQGTDKLGEQLVGPKAAVETKAKLIKIALSFQEEGLHIGDQGVYPGKSTADLVKDLVKIGISLTRRGTKGAVAKAGFFRSNCKGRTKESLWRHSICFIILLMFRAMAEMRQ